MKLRADVIIVGAGTTGLYLSKLLSSGGFQTLVLEKKEKEPGNRVCAGIISLSGFKKFSLPPSILKGVMDSVEVRFENGRRYFISFSHSPGAIVERKLLNEYFFNEARAEGAEILLGARVFSITENEKRVTVKFTLKGEELSADGKVCVIATGSDNFLAEIAGVSPPLFQITGSNMVITEANEEKNRLYYLPSLIKKGFSWVVNEEGEKIRLGYIGENNVDIKKLIQTINLQLKRDISLLSKPLRRKINQGLSPRPAKGRICLAGESAGLVKTTTGGGIIFGMKSAEIISENIKSFFHGKTQDLSHLGETFEREFGMEIRCGLMLKKILLNKDIAFLTYLAELTSSNGILNKLLSVFSFDKHEPVIHEFFKIFTKFGFSISCDI